jgi:hypothetical protein
VELSVFLVQFGENPYRPSHPLLRIIGLTTKTCQNVYKGDIAMPTLTIEIINAAILGFEEQKHRLEEQIAELRSLLPGATPPSQPADGSRRKMSAAGRKAIAAAQRKRWAAKKAESNGAPAKSEKPKRKLSAAGKAAIVAALKKRWAAKRAATAESSKKTAQKK